MRKYPRKPSIFLRILAFLTGIFALGLSIYSVYCGHIRAGGKTSGHVFYRATDPKTFWYCAIVYALVGVGAIYISTRSSDE
jgi:hypothetical protein